MATTLVLQKQGKASNGLWDLVLTRYSPSGRKIDSLVVNSGQGWNQTFVRAGVGMPSNYAPIEEGEWELGGKDREGNWQRGLIEWASGHEGDYTTYYNEGLGPVWMDVLPAAGNDSRRSAFGIHLDGNRSSSPGSAGCVVFRSISDLKVFVSWTRDISYGPPTRLIVDWGLGINWQKLLGVKPPAIYKIFGRKENGQPKISVLKDGVPVGSGMVKAFVNKTDGNLKLGIVLNNEEVDWENVSIVLTYKQKT